MITITGDFVTILFSEVGTIFYWIVYVFIKIYLYKYFIKIDLLLMGVRICIESQCIIDLADRKHNYGYIDTAKKIFSIKIKLEATISSLFSLN